MKKTNWAFLSGMLWLKIGILLPVTLIVGGERTLAGTRLPPPPSVRQPNRRAINPKPPVSPPPATRPAARREYVFRAPAPVRPATWTNSRPSRSKLPTLRTLDRTKPLPRSLPFGVRGATSSARANPPRPQRMITSDRLFRVQVSGNSAATLDRIKTIEPLAFIRPGENAIQAGIFQQQYQANQRVRELASIGFTARIISLEGDRF